MPFSKRQLSLIVDLIVVGLASVAALALRENFTISNERWWEFLPYLAVTLLVAGSILVVFQLDRSVWRFSGLADYVRAAVASVMIVIAALAIGFIINRLDGVSRSLPVLQVIVMAAGLVGTRVLVRMVHDRRRQRARAEPVSLPSAKDTVLLVGWGSVTELFVRSVAELGNGSIHVAGILAPNARHVGRLVQSTEVLGRPEDLRDVLADLDVHGIHVGRLVITTSFDQLSEAARQTLLDVESTTDVRLDFFAERLGGEGAARAVPATDQANVALEPSSRFALEKTEVDRLLRRPYWRVKRTIDAAVALVLLIALMPVVLLVALVVAFDVGVPVLFVQQRPGRRGARFNLYKFRTMGQSHDRYGTKLSDEARLSRIGAFLRRTRLDELPQLYNILAGDMSFVGPRPLVTREQSSDILARLLVRPGLTGWAQVRGGRVVSVADKTALDLWYVRHAGLGLDLKILAATVPMILFGERVHKSAVRLAWRDLRAIGLRDRVGERRRAA
jgi:lipopolysaccharide/colanic/teichoic acid biosynthesis glycosyltransferase